MVEMTPNDAREFWKALIDNASFLIADAHTLLAAESYGRARSLTVLAQEELGKDLWIYAAFESAWSQGDERPRTERSVHRAGAAGFELTIAVRPSFRRLDPGSAHGSLAGRHRPP